MTTYAAAFLAALLGVLLGRWIEARNWRLKSGMQYGRMLSGGRFFWVVAEDNTEACRQLEDLLRRERQHRAIELQSQAVHRHNQPTRKY